MIHLLKQRTIDYGLSGFTAFAVCLFGIDNVTIYGSDLVDMCSYGKLLFLLPLTLSPIAFILALKLLRIVREKNKLRAASIYILIYISMALIPSVAISALSSLELDSIEISKYSLNNSEIQKLQSLEVSTNVFPFVVRFHWQRDEIRVVFKQSKGRDRIVKDILSAALTGDVKGSVPSIVVFSRR